MKHLGFEQFSLQTESRTDYHSVPVYTLSGNVSDDFENLKKLFYDEKSEFSWSVLAELLTIDEVDDYIDEILIMLKSKPVPTWYMDGPSSIYEVIFKHFAVEELTATLSEISSSFFYYSEKYQSRNLYSLKIDLNYFTQFFYKSFSPLDGVRAFNEMASMHIKWITANGKLNFEEKYTLPPAEEVRDWVDFCNKLSSHLT